MPTPFAQKIKLDEANQKILRENRQQIGGFTLFKQTFLGQLWNMVKTNWLMLAFCIPVVAWLFFSTIRQGNLDSTIPYSANVGIGYPVVNDAHIMGRLADFKLAMNNALVMLPMIIVAFAGFAGVFNVIKYLCWGMKVKIIKTFFKGIKNSFAAFIWMGLLAGLCYILLVYLSYLDVLGVALGWKVAALCAGSLLSAFVLLLCVFVLPQAVVFDMPLLDMLKNAVRLSGKFILQNLLILIAGAASMCLLFLSFNSLIQIIAYMLFFMLAFSWTATIWTIYTQFIFDAIYDENKKQKTDEKTDNKPSPSSPKKKKPAVKQPYHNPKKKKKM